MAKSQSYPQICVKNKLPSLISFPILAYTSTMEISRFPNKLKMIRRCHGYSQKKVAHILGLADTSTLSRWEHGVAIPSTVQVFRLARIYQTLPHELFEELWNLHGLEKHLLARDEEPFNSNQSIFV